MPIGGSTAAAQLATLPCPVAKAAPISSEERVQRIEKARRLTRDLQADALLVGAGASLRYFSGVSWGATERMVAMLLPVVGKPVFICPAFERGSLEAELQIDADLRLWEEDESPSALVARTLRDWKSKQLVVDPAMAFDMVHAIGREAGGVAIGTAAPVIHGCRMTKSATELALMQQAKSTTLEVHRRAALILREGITQSAVREFINEAHRRMGTSGSSFCAVQFGEATAYPHGIPGDPTLREGDVVLIDTGCTIDGYNSDITRTYVFGKPNAKQRATWDVEKEAQAAAFARVQPGVPCEAVDAAARVVLERAGFGPDYKLPGLPHRTGHGIGLSIHEPPYLVRGDATPLAPGMCFSNEPMIVIPGEFGIRLEDHFYVTEQGAKWFTTPSPSIEQPFA